MLGLTTFPQHLLHPQNCVVVFWWQLFCSHHVQAFPGQSHALGSVPEVVQPGTWIVSHAGWHWTDIGTNRKSPVSQNIFFFWLVQNCMTLSWWFSHKNGRILHRAVHQPVTFSQLQSLMSRFEPVTEELWLHLQCHFVCTCTNHLAMKGNYYSRLLN